MWTVDVIDFTVFIYCKTTNFSVLLILAILANGIRTLVLIHTNIYNSDVVVLDDVDNATLNSH